jgi:hypothetical protein
VFRLDASLAVGFVCRPICHLTVGGAEVDLQAAGALLEPRAVAARIPAMRPDLEVCSLLGLRSNQFGDVCCGAILRCSGQSVGAILEQVPDELDDLMYRRTPQKRAAIVRCLIDIST